MITTERLEHFSRYYARHPGEKGTAVLELVSAVLDLRSTHLADQHRIRELTSAVKLQGATPEPTLPVDEPELDTDTDDLDVDRMRDRLIHQAHRKFDGHRQQMSDATGIAIRTLSGHLRRLGYPPRSRGTDEPLDPSNQTEVPSADPDRID